MRLLKDLSLFTDQKATCFFRSGRSSSYKAGNYPRTDTISVQNEFLEAQKLYCRYVGRSEVKDFYFQRRMKQPFLSLEYICSGEFHIRSGEKGYVAEAGDLCLLHPGMDHDLMFCSDKRCCKLGIIISGEVLPDVLKALHLEHVDVVSLPDSGGLDDIFECLRDSLLNVMNRRACERNAGYTFELLQMISNACKSQPFPRSVVLMQEYFERHHAENLNMKQFAAKQGMSLPTLNRIFRSALQMTPYQYLIKLRMHRAAYLLRENNLTVKEIAEKVGYNNPLYFSSEFRRIYGCPPREYRKK